MHHVRNFRKCQGRIIEKKKDFVDSIILDPVQGTLSGNLLANGREVLWRYAELPCIPRYFTLLLAVLMDQGKKTHEHLRRKGFEIRRKSASKSSE